MRSVLLLIFLLTPHFLLAAGLTISERFVEGNNSRLAFGLGLGVHSVAKSALYPTADGFGLQRLGGQIFHANEFVSGFEIMSSISMGGSSFGKLFSRSAADAGFDGFFLDTQLGFRYLHPVTTEFDIGGQFSIGYGVIFSQALKSALSDLGLAWPLHLKIGPAGRITLNNDVTVYFSLLYTLSGIGKTSVRTAFLALTPIGGVNKNGIELPAGATWAFSEQFSLFAESNIALRDFSTASLGFMASLDVGIMVDFIR